MTTGAGPKSTGEMMADIMGNVGNLVRNEVDLARAEMSGSLNKASGALGRIGVAIIVAIAGVNLLAAAVVGLGISAGLPPLAVTGAVGAVLLLASFALFSSARSILNQIGFVPKRAARSVQRDANAIKEAYNDK